jgi:hypothetical protein
VSGTDLWIAGVLAAATLLALALLHRPLLALGFDRSTASALGVRPLAVDVALLGLVAAAIVVGVQALGNLLVLALLVAPAATAPARAPDARIDAARGARHRGGGSRRSLSVVLRRSRGGRIRRRRGSRPLRGGARRVDDRAPSSLDATIVASARLSSSGDNGEAVAVEVIASLVGSMGLTSRCP